MIKPIIALALALAAQFAGAQGYPNRAITLVVPFPPGGSTDITARILAEAMRPTLGQSVVVENQGGASGTIALARVARAAPDGYTIDIGQWDTHVGAIIYPIQFDLLKDFAPIGLISVNAQLMIARKDFPPADLKGLIAYAKANPGRVTWVEQTVAARLAGEQFQKMTGTTVQFVPYRGAGPAMQAMLAGQVDIMVLQAAAALPQSRAGAVKMIANLSPQRSKVIADIPTSDEAGLPGLYGAGWFGLFGPRGMPAEAVTRLNAALVAALADAKVQARLAELGLDLAPRAQQSPEGLAAFQKAEIDKWWPVIKAANIKVE
jgi:tripartite-type tricarboxylate transporter receptor subunit TctC